MSEQERTPSGDPIVRHEEPLHEFQPAAGDGENIEAISAHIEKHIGKVDMVLHEIVSHLVHIDVHWVKPARRFPFHVLITSGMSDKAMNVPEDHEDLAFAELCILLPSDWNIGIEEFQVAESEETDENNYWPVRWLKTMARFPHEYNTWLGWGHTVPNGMEVEPYAENTTLGCMLLLPSISLPKDFFELKTKAGKLIRFYCLYPLYKEEMEYKMNKGKEALIDKFEEYGIMDVVDINRRNVCKKKGLFGLFGK